LASLGSVYLGVVRLSQVFPFVVASAVILSCMLVVWDLRAEDRWPAVFEHAAPSVVQVRVGEGWGSGFVYPTSRHVVTAYSVVNQEGPLTVALDDGSVTTARVVAWSEADDLAIVELLVPVETPALDVERGRPYSGEKVAALGYSTERATEKRVHVDVPVPRFGTVSVVRPRRLDLDMGEQSDGNAGAPVLSPSGTVIGVVSLSGRDVSKGIVTAVGAEAVVALSKKMRARGQFEPSQPPAEQSVFGGVFVTPLEQDGFVGAGLEGGYRYEWLVASANIGAVTSWYAPDSTAAFAQRQREFLELHVVAQMELVEAFFWHIGPSVEVYVQDTKVRTLPDGDETSENIDAGVRPLLDIGGTAPSFLVRGVFDPLELGARLDIGVFFGR